MSAQPAAGQPVTPAAMNCPTARGLIPGNVTVGIFFSRSHDFFGEAIQIETGGPSHCGFWWREPDGSEWAVDALFGIGVRQYRFDQVRARPDVTVEEIVVPRDQHRMLVALTTGLRCVGDPYDLAIVLCHPLGRLGWWVGEGLRRFCRQERYDCSGFVGTFCRRAGLPWAKGLGPFCAPIDVQECLVGEPAFTPTDA